MAPVVLVAGYLAASANGPLVNKEKNIYTRSQGDFITGVWKPISLQECRKEILVTKIPSKSQSHQPCTPVEVPPRVGDFHLVSIKQ